MILLTADPIDASACLEAFELGAPQSGAIVCFSGKVRSSSAGEAVRKLHLQAYPPMTGPGIAQAVADACERWSLEAVSVVHRVGDVSPGETIVFVAAASKHRRAAFEAADYLMDFLKTRAVFWKKEVTDTGERWIEPRTEDYADVSRWHKEEVS